MMKLVVCAVLTLCLLPGLLTGQTKPAEDVWDQFDTLLASGKELATGSLVFRRLSQLKSFGIFVPRSLKSCARS